MEEKVVQCIVCPAGCMVTVKLENGQVLSVEGNTCPRGKEYATTEVVCPKRMLTSSLLAKGYKAPVISVRSSQPIEKERIIECMEVLRGVTVEAPFEVGRVVVPNILDTGADIILTNY